MINIKNLSKKYNKGEQEVLALKNINLTLPDSGFVFVVGKSGCGKSTLLNLMGGLDNVTDGDIVCDGNHLSKFGAKELDDYRNSYLGFVFQDYSLIEDLTVFENIALVLDINGEKLSKHEKNEKVEKALRSVDLEPKIQNRKIKELSGGQKQRVAIARALIKNPKLILADEPTGNLDGKTSKTILELLKELSSDRLVVIVSHNNDDALTYADRIVELSDGKIISDSERINNENNELTIADGVLTLPHSKTLTDKQLQEINENLTNNKIKEIKQQGSGFGTPKEVVSKTKKVKIESKKISFKSSSLLAGQFLRKRIFAGTFTIIAITLLVFVLGICQFFLQFNAPNAIFKSMKDNHEESVLVYKGYFDDNDKLNDKNYVYVTDDDIAAFRDAGYTGKIYSLYRNPFCFATYYSEKSERVSDKFNFNGRYINETYGTLLCDEEYLINTFGTNGSLEMICGSLDARPYGVVIPDYVADSIMSARPHYATYESLLDNLVCERRYINGIFKTDYQEKYNDLFQYLKDVNIGINRKEEKEFYKNKYSEFLYELKMYYGLAYSVNPNFAEDIKNIDYIDHSFCSNYSISYENVNLSFDSLILYRTNSSLNLTANEIAMEFDVFNGMFGEMIGHTFDEVTYRFFRPTTIKFIQYDGYGNEIFSQDLTIKKLLPATYIGWTTAESQCIFTSTEMLQTFHNYSQGVYGLMFEDASQLDKIYTTIENNAYSVSSKVYNSINSVGKIVDIFENLFSVILLGITGICILLLINYSYGNIKKRYYEIGVLKALGLNTKSVGLIFSFQTVIAGLIICIVSTVMLLTLSSPINLQLSNQLLEYVGNTNLQTILVIQPNALTIVINILVIVSITTLSCFIPFIKLHKIKPKNIILNK